MRCLFALWLVQAAALQRIVDIVTPLAAKDATVYRFNLRHALKHVQNIRNVYVVCRPTKQMKAIVAHANSLYTRKGAQEVILVDEAVFPFNFETIRSYLREHRPDEGFDGQPFDGTVVVPPICRVTGPKLGTKEWVHNCRQPHKNETVSGGTEVVDPYSKKGTPAKLQTFERTGWILQQFLKMGVTPEYVPGIGEAYLVLDADTIFYQDYNPIPPDSEEAYNYMPGDGRDCSNPPYFMTLDAMAINKSVTKVRSCAGHPNSPNGRRCKDHLLCPIAHGMVYSRKVLSSFHNHLESTIRDSKGGKVAWWQAVLQLMPSWHTSPFSEYVTYYAYALQHFPETVRVYDAEQLGASEEEIPANYYMGNGIGVSGRCNMQGFSEASKAQRKTHSAATGYCTESTHPKDKKFDACETYDKSKHNGKPCPAPKYESYHGFRNVLFPWIDKVFLEYDLAFAKEHAEAMSRVQVITTNDSARERIAPVTGEAGRTHNGGAVTAAADETEMPESALTALDVTIGKKRKTAGGYSSLITHKPKVLLQDEGIKKKLLISSD